MTKNFRNHKSIVITTENIHMSDAFCLLSFVYTGAKQTVFDDKSESQVESLQILHPGLEISTRKGALRKICNPFSLKVGGAQAITRHHECL